MATPPIQKLSNGEVLKHSHPKNSSKKGGKKPLKSNITNKVRSARSMDSASAGAAESDDEESDSSAIEEHKDSDEDADAFALSNGRQQAVGGAERRSAGPQSKNEDMVTNDDIEQDTEDDDNDQYADVEDISDSDLSDDEGDVDESQVLRSVEHDLIGEFERSEQRREANGVANAISDMALNDEARDIALAQQLSLQDANPHVGMSGFEVNMDDDPFVGLTQNDSIYNAMWNEAELAMWRRPGPGSPRPSGNSGIGTQKRVRFEEVNDVFSRESSSGSSEDGNDAFPDLFASQDDPVIQQHLALDVDDDNGLLPYDWGDLESCYDFDGDEEDIAFQLDEEDDSDGSDEDSDSSDSDGGDTTDEESAEEQKARFHERRAAAMRLKGTPVTPTPTRPVLRSGSTPSTPRPSTPKSGRGPQMGTFVKDPTRATITNDSVARRTKIEPPRNPPEKDRAFWENVKRANLKPGSRRGSCITVPSPGSETMPDRPFTAQSTLGTMFNGNLDLIRNNDAVGGRVEFHPPPLSNAQLSFSATSPTEDSEDDYADINMQDFVEMSDSDSDDDARPESSHMDSPSESEMYSSSRNMGLSNASPGLLNHFEFNRGLVGSFRKNQQSTKHFSSLPSHPAKRASTHEYNALQKGRRGAANTPMTPARKKRASQDLTHISGGVRKSIGSPLTSRRPRSRGNSITTKNAAGLYDTLAASPF